MQPTYKDVQFHSSKAGNLIYMLHGAMQTMAAWWYKHMTGQYVHECGHE